MHLTIKTDDKRTVTVPALMVEGKEDRAGVVTAVVNGVTYLVELHTRNGKFVFENGTEASKRVLSVRSTPRNRVYVADRAGTNSFITLA